MDLFSDEDLLAREEAARQKYRRDMGYHEQSADQFRKSVDDQLAIVRQACAWLDGTTLSYVFDDEIKTGPVSVFLNAFEQRVEAGYAVVSFDDALHIPKVITFKRSIKPKKPKNPDIMRAMPVHLALSPEEREERRVKREAMKAALLRQREEQLAFLREQYGDGSAQAYAALMGWR